MKNLIFVAIILAGLSACTALKSNSDRPGLAKLEGNWELEYISGPRIAFNGLYPDRKPVMKIEVADKRVSGNSSCNSYSGKLVADDTHIRFDSPFVTTKMACQGEGEAVFFQMLKKVSQYTITGGKTLNLMMGDVSIMRFKRK